MLRVASEENASSRFLYPYLVPYLVPYPGMYMYIQVGAGYKVKR